jgi:hypothetical protein
MRRASISALAKVLPFSGIKDQPLSRPFLRLRRAETSPATNCFRLSLLMSPRPRAIKVPIVAAAMVLTLMSDLHVQARTETGCHVNVSRAVLLRYLQAAWLSSF